MSSLFWEVAEPFLQKGFLKSTIFGFPCIRWEKDFIACPEHRSGDLIVKLNQNKVDELIDQGVGRTFSPNGRKFKEWVCVPHRDAELWRELIQDAYDLALQKRPKK